MSKPNLLFIYTDEQRYNTMAAYGNTQIQMPNLNKFCESATVFDEAYVTQPVCTPSRSTLLTGQWPHTNGLTANNIPLKKETKCLPEMVEGDYKTAHFGKWHLGDELWAQHGFDEWLAIEDMYRPHYSEGRDRNEVCHYVKWLIEKHKLTPPGEKGFWNRGEAAKLDEKYSKPAYLAEVSCQFLEENKDNPFILYVNFLEPHMPFFGPRDDQYDPDSIPLPGNFEAVPDESTHPRSQANYTKWHKQYSSEKEMRELIARYWGLCSEVDTHAGTILDKLEELGLDENTIVVYTSDHGDMMGSHQLVAKTVQYQEAVRVPFMIRMHGQKESKRVNGPVSQIDVVPTLLDLMGQGIPEDCQGKSLKSAVLGQTDTLTDDVIIEWNGDNGVAAGIKIEHSDIDPEEMAKAINDPIRTIITADGWRFSCSPMGYHELFNLNEDRGETRNLAHEDSRKPLMRELREKIIAWQQETGDTVELPEVV